MVFENRVSNLARKNACISYVKGCLVAYAMEDVEDLFYF